MASAGGDCHVAARGTGLVEAPRAGTARREILEWIIIICAALTVAIVVRTAAIQAFYIPSESMTPTLQVHDRVLVDKLSYRFTEVDRGDVVVFQRPATATSAAKDLVKRVVALGGDTVEARGGVLFVNGEATAETFTQQPDSTQNLPLTTIPPGHVWVMGDNRTNSGDSRVFGPVEVRAILGRARLRVWPVNRLGTL